MAARKRLLDQISRDKKRGAARDRLARKLTVYRAEDDLIRAHERGEHAAERGVYLSPSVTCPRCVAP